MCSYATSSPSAGQTRFCWMRTLSSSCSWWKRTLLRDTALYSFTGTLTRPKLIAPLQIALAIDRYLSARGPGPSSIRTQVSHAAVLAEAPGRDVAAPRWRDSPQVVIILPRLDERIR